MKTLEIQTLGNNNVEVEVSFRNQFSGYGHYKIICDARFNGKSKEFKLTTNDMPWMDSLSDFKAENPTWEQEIEFYLEKFQDNFEEMISEWVDEELYTEED